jgi:hypothetical protein
MVPEIFMNKNPEIKTHAYMQVTPMPEAGTTNNENGAILTY